jgi:hypothetical protein
VFDFIRGNRLRKTQAKHEREEMGHADAAFGPRRGEKGRANEAYLQFDQPPL